MMVLKDRDTEDKIKAAFVIITFFLNLTDQKHLNHCAYLWELNYVYITKFI